LVSWLLGAVVGAVLLAACAPATPDSQAWRASAVQTLEDTSSQLATMRLTVEQERQDRLPGRYAVAVAVDSEEQAATAAESLTSQQPPGAERRAYDRVSSLLDDAQSLISEARIALVAGRTPEYPSLLRRLDRLGARTDRETERLR
jgi:hypothetical protein